MAKYINFTSAVQGVGAANTPVTVSTQPTLATTNGSTDTLTINCNGHGLSVGSPISIFWSTAGDANAAALGLAGDYYVFSVTNANNFTIIPTAATNPSGGTNGVFAVRRRIASPVLIDPNKIIYISNPTTSAVELRLATSNQSTETIRIVFSSADAAYATHEFIAQAITKAASDSMGYSGAAFEMPLLPNDAAGAQRIVGFTRF